MSHPQRLLLAVITALVGTCLSFGSVEAQVKAWFACSNPALPNTVLVMPGDVVKKLKSSSDTCNMLDIDKNSSLGRACYLKWQFPKNKYLVYAPSQPQGVSALTCK